MTFVIRVLEPGAKRTKLYAGKGFVTTKWIHAKQYNQEKYIMQAGVDELNLLNAGYTFTLENITGTARDIFAEGPTEPIRKRARRFPTEDQGNPLGWERVQT